jgi:hypothetical protein
LQTRFGNLPEGDGNLLRAGIPPLSTEERAELERRREFFKQQKEGAELEIKVLETALGITQAVAPDPVSASEAAPASVEKSDGSREVSGETAEEDHQETQAPPQSKYTPRSERNRLNVGWDMTKEYMGSNKVWVDMGVSVAVGAVCAIGSPVMAVTIPTTMMVIGGFRLMLLLAKIVQKPKGDNIENMYQNWMKTDAERAKKAAEPSS